MKDTSSAGYTLLELLVVIALVALVTAIAAPASISAVDGARLSADARTLVSEIRSLQADARSMGRRPVLTADAEGRLLVSGDALVLPNGSTASLVGTKSIVFYENGTVSEGRIRLELGDRRLDVKIAWVTGTPTIVAMP